MSTDINTLHAHMTDMMDLYCGDYTLTSKEMNCYREISEEPLYYAVVMHSGRRYYSAPCTTLAQAEVDVMRKTINHVDAYKSNARFLSDMARFNSSKKASSPE